MVAIVRAHSWWGTTTVMARPEPYNVLRRRSHFVSAAYRHVRIHLFTVDTSSPHIEPFFDARTSTMTYVVLDGASGDAVVIDPVLDYEPASSTTWSESVDRVVDYLEQTGATLRLILETHAHADHLSGAPLLKRRFPGVPLAVGARITEVQARFARIYGLPDDFPTDGRQFDRLLADGEEVRAGTLRFRVIHTPGHTPADASYLFEDAGAVFVGDTLFMPDGGCGRCDFPAGSASDLYRSVQEKLYTLPDDTDVYVGHDYQPGGRALAFRATLAEQKASNTAIPASRTERDFVAWRDARDATLSTPKLLLQSIQVNIDAGELPPPDDAGMRYLKIPLNVFRPPTEGKTVLEDLTPSSIA